ncbi:hypothetical protein M0802_006370 [Mischocyttarus mexicanus]|nr:hypothetical protein M0802_006370 [Mischocyttarus mexicanus]
MTKYSVQKRGKKTRRGLTVSYAKWYRPEVILSSQVSSQSNTFFTGIISKYHLKVILSLQVVHDALAEGVNKYVSSGSSGYAIGPNADSTHGRKLILQLQKCQNNDKKNFNESLTSFVIDFNNNLDRPLKTAPTKYGIISLEDIIIQDENNYPKDYDYKNLGQPILDVNFEENSNGSSNLKKNQLKRKFASQYQTEVPGIMKRDMNEMTESNNEKFNNYYPANYSSLNDEFAFVNSKMTFSKDCRHYCNSQSFPLNIHNTNSQIEKNHEDYSNDHEYSFKSNQISSENYTNNSYSSCCCWKTNEIPSKECTSSKSSLIVETGESMLEFSTSWPSNSNLTNVCACSNESSMIEVRSTMNEDIQRGGPFEKKKERVEGKEVEVEKEGKKEGKKVEKDEEEEEVEEEEEEHAMIDKCGARCKSKDFKHEPCCSHFTSKKHSSIENSTWSQLEMVESKARRLDYGRRENIRWRGDVGTSSNVRSVTKRPRYCESLTENTSERQKIPKDCQNSLFRDFEIGKVWSHVHDTCKNFVQSAITNISQTIKDISRSKDTPEDKENEILNRLLRNSKGGLVGGECSKSCQMKK